MTLILVRYLTVISLAIDINQDLYFIESDGSDSYLRKVDKCGLITTPKFKKLTASTPTMDAPRSLVIDSSNNLYISNDSLVYRITKDNILSVVAGGGTKQIDGSTQQATDILLDSPQDLAVDSSANLYITDSANHSVYRVDSDGYITTIAGVGEAGDSGDGWIGSQSKLNSPKGVVVDTEQNIYISDTLNHHIRRVDASSLFSKDTNGNKIYINANNTAEVFDSSGRHLRQIDLATNKTLVSYGYDEESGYLSSISDEFDLTTTINRDEEGSVTSIVAPNGQISHISKDENDNLAQIRYEDGSSYQFTYYDDNSLMDKMIDPNGNEIAHIFNEEGHITKEIDGEGGEYRFAKSTNANSTTYTYTNPGGNSYSSRDSITTDGNYLFEITLASGDSYSKTLSANKEYKETTRNGVVSTQKYDIDPYTKDKHLAKATITQPSGLKSTKTFTRSYEREDGSVSKKIDTTSNSTNDSTRVVTDYKNATTTITSPEGRVSSIAKDKETLLPQTITIGTLTPTTYSYDDKGRTTTETTGDRELNYTYDSRGNTATITDPRGKITSLSYDVMDRVTTVTYPNGTTKEFTYDNNSNLLQRVVPTPANHNFAYDGVDSNTNYTSPLNKATTYSYNKNKKVTQITRPSGATISNTYSKDRLVSTTTPEGTTSYSYLFANQVGAITKGAESFSFTYDGTLLTSMSQSGVLNHTTDFSYNNDFQVTSSTYAGSTNNYSYDSDGYLISSGAYTLTRDSNNGYTTQLTDNTITQNRSYNSYNSYGEITQLSDNTFTYQLTSRDKNGAITQKSETINGTTKTYDYRYDDLGRLIEVKLDNTIVEEYSYDNNGNRASATINNSTTTAQYTLDDQLEVYDNDTYRYNDDGYLIEKMTTEGTTTYDYGTLGELKEVNLPNNTTITYLQNANNQRVAKLVDGTITEKYLWANLTTLLAVYDKDDNLIQRYEYTDQRMPISMTTADSTKYYLHYDQVGSLRAISDTNHNIIKEITYDTFGNILTDSNTNFKVPFGFAGGLYDSDTQLTRFGYRDYDAYTGKWTAKDPIGFDGGDSNLYGYVLGDPINFVDPTGLILPVLTTGGGAIAGSIAGGLTGGICEAFNGGGWEDIRDAALFGAVTGAAAGAIAGSGGTLAPWIAGAVDITANGLNGVTGAGK